MSSTSRSAADSVTPVAPAGTPQTSGEYVTPWAVRDEGLAWRGDWMSVQWLADALNGPEDDGRIPEDDVEALLRVIAIGLACEPSVRRIEAYRECSGCGMEWYEGDPQTPERHLSTCPIVVPSRGDAS